MVKMLTIVELAKEVLKIIEEKTYKLAQYFKERNG